MHHLILNNFFYVQLLACCINKQSIELWVVSIKEKRILKWTIAIGSIRKTLNIWLSVIKLPRQAGAWDHFEMIDFADKIQFADKIHSNFDGQRKRKPICLIYDRLLIQSDWKIPSSLLARWDSKNFSNYHSHAISNKMLSNTVLLLLHIYNIFDFRVTFILIMKWWLLYMFPEFEKQRDGESYQNQTLTRDR